MKLLLHFSLLLIFTLGSIIILPAQSLDTTINVLPADSIISTQGDLDSSTIADTVFGKEKQSALTQILAKNTLINFRSQPVSYPAEQRTYQRVEFDFYFMLFLFAFLGLLKAAYPRYFKNLFRVFFNTSLQQGQLTDQLLQAKLTSLLFNIFFLLSLSFFFYQFLKFENFRPPQNDYKLLLVLASVLAVIYIGKFVMLKFTGWVTGFMREAESYIFIIFLVNKVLGIVLLPLSFVMSFARERLSHATLILACIVILLIFLVRFFRAYANLQPRMMVNRWHFLLYIIGMEIIPLLILFKLATELL